MSSTPQTPQETTPTQTPPPPQRLAFIFRALMHGDVPDNATEAWFYGSPTPPQSSPTSTTPSDSDKTPGTTSPPTPPPAFTTTHLNEQTYLTEFLGKLTPEFYSHTISISTPSSTSPPSTPHYDTLHLPLYRPHLLPELSSTQVNTLSNRFLAPEHAALYNDLSTILKSRLISGELEMCEYEDWKSMRSSILTVGEMDVEEKMVWQRRFVTYALLWMLAVDARYGFERAQGFVDLCDVGQVTLIWEDAYHFVVYPKVKRPDSEVEKEIAEEEKNNAAEEKKKSAGCCKVGNSPK